MKISAKQGIFDKLVKRADLFTANDLGSSAYMHSILIDVSAEDSTVRFTAENDISAIEFFADENIDIQESGKILIDSIRLRTVLGVILSDERVTIETKGERFVEITGGSTNMHVPITLIEDDKALLPKVQPAAKTGITLKAEDFRNGFLTGVVAFDSKGQRPSLNSVHISIVPVEGKAKNNESPKIRFLSFNGSATAFATVNTIAVENPEFITLVEPSQLFAAMDYVSQGNSVILAEGKGDKAGTQLHLTILAESKEGDTQVLYHLRLNTLAGGHAEFPAPAIFEKTKQIFAGATSSLKVNHAELLRLFRSAERIASLNHSGRGKDVDVNLTKKDIHIVVTGETTFEDIISLQEWDGGEDSFRFRWGLYGNALETYPGDDDLHIGIIRNDDRIVALALVNDPDAKFNGKFFPENYLAIIPTANIEDGAIIRR